MKEKETKTNLVSSQLAEERTKFHSENEVLNKSLAEKSKCCDILRQELADQKGENTVIKRKLELSLRVSMSNEHTLDTTSNISPVNLVLIVVKHFTLLLTCI